MRQLENRANTQCWRLPNFVQVCLFEQRHTEPKPSGCYPLKALPGPTMPRQKIRRTWKEHLLSLPAKNKKICKHVRQTPKANPAVTSNASPNADPNNINLLRAKHSDPAHPVRVSSILWPRPQALEEHWSSDAGIDFLDKWFSIDNTEFDNTELHTLIRKRLILPYLTGSFHPSFIEEYAGGLLMALQKTDGGIRPILCGDVWRRCFASLAVNATLIRNEAAKLFSSSYDNFIQTAGIRDGASHCAKILTCFYDNLDVSDPTDPEVIIKK